MEIQHIRDASSHGGNSDPQPPAKLVLGEGAVLGDWTLGVSKGYASTRPPKYSLLADLTPNSV